MRKRNGFPGIVCRLRCELRKFDRRWYEAWRAAQALRMKLACRFCKNERYKNDLRGIR